MEYKRLGKTDLRVSLLGLGAVQICKIPEAEAIDLVRESVNRGINLIDTAHDYPDSEDILGKGKVINLEGDFPNRKATVFFSDHGQKQLLLKFAKLKIQDN